jgi:hypothetical protein
MATGSLPFAAGSSALPAAGGVAGAGAAAPSLITETSGGASGFGPEFAATGQGAAHTTGALNAAGTAATSGTFLQKLQKYLGPALGIGGPIAQAVLSNRANNTAQQQLTQSITQAKADLARLHNQQQSALSPYTSLGAGAAGLLGQGLGVKVQMPDPAVMNNNATIGQPIGGPPVPFGGGNSQPFPGSLQRPVQGPPVGSAVPRVTPSGTSVAPAVQRASSYGGSTVKMLAPDGTTQDVPAEAVSHYKSLGAQVVS